PRGLRAARARRERAPRAPPRGGLARRSRRARDRGGSAVRRHPRRLAWPAALRSLDCGSCARPPWRRPLARRTPSSSRRTSGNPVMAHAHDPRRGRPSRYIRERAAQEGSELARVKEALAVRGLSPRKRFGQNFLIREDLADRIVEHSHLREDDVAVEI